jgi:hypothetical protein
MNGIRELIIRIRAAFNRKEVDDASQAVESLGQTGKAAGEQGASGMNAMSAASAAMSGNLQGTISAVTSLAGGVKALGMSMMQLSLVAAVLTGLVKLFEAISERAEQAAANIRNIQAGNVQAAIERITEAYAKMREETERAQGSRDKLFDVNMQELRSIQQLELAQIELNKQRELSTATTDQERAAIESKYKTMQREREAHFDTAAAGFERELLLAKANEADQAAAAAAEQVDALMEQLHRRQAQSSYAAGMATRKSHLWGTFRGQPQQYQKEGTEARADIARLISTVEKLQQTMADNTEAAAIYRKQADISLTTDRTAATGRAAAATAQETDDRMRADREAARAERERRQREIDAAQERLRAEQESRAETQRRLTARAQSEQREADQYSAAAAGLRGRSGYGAANRAAAKENAEASRAAQAAANYAAETNRIIKQLEAALKAQRDALKRIPNS